jgi:acetylornithine deacetylase/succinyl-diaminopimelate desuccinylase-like protein
MDTGSSSRTRIFARIEEETPALLAFLAEYVRHASVNPGRAPEDMPGETSSCQEWLTGQLREWDVFDRLEMWAEQTGQPNLAAVIEGGGPTGTALMYNGHTDTVGVSLEQREQWLGDPWSGEIRDGKMFGRGATDMKAGNAAFLWAMRSIRQTGLRPAADVMATITIGEETSEAEIGPLSALRRGYRAPLIVNGEPTSLHIAPAGMGWFFFRLTIEGKSLHPAARYRAVYPQPDQEPVPGVDAIEKMRAVMDALSGLERDWALNRKHPLMAPGGMNLSPVWIQGGSYRAEMPPSCEAVFAVVVRPGDDCQSVLAEIEAAIEGVAARDSWLRAHPPKIEFPVIHAAMEPLDTPVDHPGVVALAGAFRAALGREPVFGAMPGPCDANFMAAEGESVVIFGPGDLAFGAHGTNEYVPVQQVIDACKVYAGLILDWCGAADG